MKINWKTHCKFVRIEKDYYFINILKEPKEPVILLSPKEPVAAWVQKKKWDRKQARERVHKQQQYWLKNCLRKPVQVGEMAGNEEVMVR